MIRVAAIVVTYNRKHFLLRNINCLLNQSYMDGLDIIIIDNNSTDGTYAHIQNLVTNGSVIYINTKKNLGGAGGFNIGIRYAVEHNYEYIWVMDDDCMPRSDALENLYYAAVELDYEFGFLSSKVLWKDGSICSMNKQKVCLSCNVTDFHSKMVKIITSTFVSMFFSSEVVRELGLPIKDFFIWCDDLEYSRRISRKYKSYLVNSSVVVHECNDNIGSDISMDSVERLERYGYAYRNEIYYYKREGLLGIVYACIRICVHLIRILINSTDHKRERLLTVLSATKRGLNFNPPIEYITSRGGV